MMKSSSTTRTTTGSLTLAVVSTTLFLASDVDAHGLVTSPRSRNWRAHIDGLEYDQNGLNRKVSETNLYGSGLCGSVLSRNYDNYLSSKGLGWFSEATYNKGQVIEITTKLTAYHGGHLEIGACADASPTQECFDLNKLEYVGGGHPVDEFNPERAYLGTPAYSVSNREYTHSFKLPSELSGSQVLLQWRYFTANSCEYEGYNEYFALQGWASNSLVDCDSTILDNDGGSGPERFWNCMEVTINGEPTPPTTPAPVVPTSVPTPQPTSAPIPTTPAPVPPTTPTNYAEGTCGGGSVGNGICSNGMCCSQWGYCGTSSSHCTGTPPTPPTAPTPPPPPTTPSLAGTDSHLIAYLGNWHTCPTTEQVADYTHIVIAFAVSYQYNAAKNICSETCEISTPPVCNNAANPTLIQEWQAAGKKVILSFGGAGMGGSWAGDANDCWEYCYGRENQVVSRLTDIVNDMGLDGVDLDYEYFYEDNQNGSGFSKGLEAQKFLKDVTLGLKANLPQGSIVTHAPMDPDALPGNAYYDTLVEVSDSLDFLMPQYYNGFTRPAIDGVDGSGSGSVSALSHYTNLVDNMFGGDATKVVFGFCIQDCGGTGSNASGDQAKQVMTDLGNHFSCNGGAFFWVADDDNSGLWSSKVNEAIRPNAGCSTGTEPSTPATPYPSSAPITAAPTPLPSIRPLSPTPVPTIPPSQSPVVSTPVPTAAPVDSSSCCPIGSTAMVPTNSCTQFYHCDGNGGINGSPISCGAGLLFNSNGGYCDWAYNVPTCNDCPVPGNKRALLRGGRSN